MKYAETIDKLREAKREALANSCNIKIGRRELEVALKALEIVNKELPDMREKVKEYISELDAEIDRCHKEISNLSYDEVQVRANRAEINVYQCRAKTLTEVKNDLQSRLDELI